MTARPIRRNAQTPDRNGKIFYTSTTSLSHISKVAGNEAADGWRWCGFDRHHPCTLAFRFVRLISRGVCHFETRYKELTEKIKTLYQQYPNVRKVLDVDRPCELSAEDCTALVKVLKYKNEMANLELKEVYFKGCIDCVSYLKKLSILYCGVGVKLMPLLHSRIEIK